MRAFALSIIAGLVLILKLCLQAGRRLLALLSYAAVFVLIVVSIYDLALCLNNKNRPVFCLVNASSRQLPAEAHVDEDGIVLHEPPTNPTRPKGILKNRNEEPLQQYVVSAIRICPLILGLGWGHKDCRILV